MSGSASLGVEQAMLSHTLGIGPVAAVSRAYVALCLASLVPDERVRGVEASGNGYARMAASFQVLASPPNMAANTTTVAFPTATAPWGVLGYFELWDAPHGGNRLYWGALVDPADGTTPITLSVSAGDVLRFSAGALGVRIGPSGSSTVGGAFLPLVGGTLASPGNLTVGGWLTVTGAAATLGGPLSVTGPTALAGGATITGDSAMASGNFTLAFDPTLPLHAATKQYVDGGGGGGGGPFLPTSGGVLNGPGNLVVGGTLGVTGTTAMAGALTLSAPAGGWSNNNFGRQLLVTTTGATNPAIGITDSAGGRLIGISNNGGTLRFTEMPAYNDGVTAPVSLLQLDSVVSTATGPWLHTGVATSLPSPNGSKLDLDWTYTNTASGGSGVSFLSLQNIRIQGAPNQGIWVDMTQLNYSGTGGTGGHVAKYAQVNRSTFAAGGTTNNPILWGGIFEVNDFTDQKSADNAGILCLELDLASTREDNASNRQMISGNISTKAGGAGYNEAGVGYYLAVHAGSYIKRFANWGGPYTVAGLDFRSADFYAPGSINCPVIVSNVTASASVPVTNIMPFLNDNQDRNINNGHTATIYFDDGTTATMTAYTITGTGATPTGTITLSAPVTKASGMRVANDSRAIWFRAYHQISFDLSGTVNLWGDGTTLFNSGAMAITGALTASTSLSTPLISNGLGGAMTIQSAPGFNLNFNPLPASVGSPGTAVALNGQLIHNLYANGTPPITGLSFDGARFVASSDSIVVAPGQAVNWVDIIGNLGALQWQASTAVTINLTRNNGGRVYICRAAGTTAASGGPTGTGTGITDGTAVWDYQSSDFVGIHQALNVTMNVRSTTGPTATNQQRQWPAFISTFTGYGNQGGTAPSSGYALGIGYAGALQSWLMATGTNWQSIGGMEVDVGIFTGATAKTRYGLNIVSYGNLQAAQEDCAIGFGTSNAGGAPPWNNILMLGEGAVLASGTNSIISYKPRPPGALAGGTYLNPGAALGVDLANIAFSTAAIRTPGGGGIDGRGYLFSGGARLSTSGGIVALDAIGSIVTAIASLDVTTPPLGFKAGDQVYALDGSGSIVTINTVDGAGLPLTWTLTVAGGALAAPPANPVTFYGGSGAVSARFNLTWTRADGLSLNPTGQKIGAFGATPIVKPTGVAVTAAGIHAALTSLGWIAP